jgi:hypothetical protein
MVAPSNIKMTIFKRRASTVWNRFNFTIMDFTDLSDPTAVGYDPEDFFGFYDVILAIDQNQTDWVLSSQFALLVSISAFLDFHGDNQIDPGGGSRDFRLQEFLAAPIALFNTAARGDIADDMGISITLAIPSYRVKPP